MHDRRPGVLEQAPDRRRSSGSRRSKSPDLDVHLEHVGARGDAARDVRVGARLGEERGGAQALRDGAANPAAQSLRYSAMPGRWA